MADELAVFQDRIRKVWHENEWWFSVVDVVEVLTDSPSPRQYWGMLKKRMTDEGATQSLTDCLQLKMRSRDGKLYKTDAATTETILRIIQSIPSPRAEPFKQWLAAVGTERIQEAQAAPTVAELRLMANYRRLGYNDKWIMARMEKLRARSAIIFEWGARGAVENRHFARLTDTLSKGTFDITTREHRQVKGLAGKHNLQDSMTPVELALSTLSEVTAVEFHQARDSQGVNQLQEDCRDAGDIAGNARREIEQRIGKPVVSSTNYKQLQQERQRELQPGLFDQPED
jgi:DNA-damage-inducible protein D